MGTDIHGVFQAKVDGKWLDVPSNYEQNRHYLLFAWLGNVRNGYGFAGVPTHSPITPLSDNRGLPHDFAMDGDSHPIASADIRAPRRREFWDAEDPDYLREWMGDHSHSWLTADEILAGVEPLVIWRTGVVKVDAFRAWDGESQPEAWSGGVAGRGVLVSLPEQVTDATTHVQITWRTDMFAGLEYFLDEVRRLKEQHGEVRFVFGFDS